MTDRPECEKQHAYLVRMFFGAEDEKNGFISRAYRDMSRTLHGLSELKNKEALKANAREALLKSLRELKSQSVLPVSNDLAAEFDAWHRRACTDIVRSFAPFHCHYGQAQKWLNMTNKYRWFFSDESELKDWYPVAHIPVDDYVLRGATRCKIARPAKAEWSRWDKEEYEALCVPKTLSVLMEQWNHLSWWNDRAVLFRSGRAGLAVQVEVAA